ncbi:MAG: DUF2341 domain-containing protein [Akkermansiaceae bacterium]
MKFALIAASIFLTSFAALGQNFGDWKHKGSIFIITTPDGADLPASAEILDFPLLIRLHQDSFPFSETHANGHDVRFSMQGKSLPHEIESWDAERGEAQVWVRVPLIKGNASQKITIHWGNSNAKPASDSKAVFNASNGYATVWHLNERVVDATGNLTAKDLGSTVTHGVIGKGRQISDGKGITAGRAITTLPAGAAAHSTQAWFKSDTANGRIVCWGVEKRAGKVTMVYKSPPSIRMDCYFSGGNAEAAIPGSPEGWHHVVHTYENGKAALYIDGARQTPPARNSSPMAIPETSGFWIGGWYDRYDFTGTVDELRVSTLARSADWIRLEYENQKPMQSLVGPVVQSGDRFSVKPTKIQVKEGKTVELIAEITGAHKVFWTLIKGDEEKVIATDRTRVALSVGRVTGDQTYKIRLDAIYPKGLRTLVIPLAVAETLPEPEFVLNAPEKWNGRDVIEIKPTIKNLKAMKDAGVGQLDYRWKVDGVATLNKTDVGKLTLERSLGEGTLTASLTLSNKGSPITKKVKIIVSESKPDRWVRRPLVNNELPQDGQFYARDHTGMGTLYCRGTLNKKVSGFSLKVYTDGKLYLTTSSKESKNGNYFFAAKLKPGLVKYRIELLAKIGNSTKVIHKASDIVCGDAYIIIGQSNALATDTREDSPRITSPWIRSYGRPRFYEEDKKENLWCKPVWKAQKEHLAELGWWGMELAKNLVKSQQVPIFIMNGAKGGTRIDQHQRNDANPTDLDTIYGRQLWRLKQAGLTHGIRAIIWHQGENDQGAAGPDGGYGWETYQKYFVEMSADWKRDFPNANKLYVFQIFPNACSMGNGNGNMLREKQRTLPDLYSNMTVLSTVGVKPPGGCHYPLKGWAEFSNMLHPLILRDVYGKKDSRILTPPNLKQAYFTGSRKDSITLEFDQPVVWDQELARDIRLDGEEGWVLSGEASNNTVTLKLKTATKAKTVSYLDERAWSKNRLLIGKNGIAALTFHQVPININKAQD